MASGLAITFSYSTGFYSTTQLQKKGFATCACHVAVIQWTLRAVLLVARIVVLRFVTTFDNPASKNALFQIFRFQSYLKPASDRLFQNISHRYLISYVCNGCSRL